MINEKLLKRANHACELCGNSEGLEAFDVSGADEIVICQTCKQNMQQTQDVNHWRCLNESIWSEIQAVQVLSYRILKSLQNEEFARDLLDMVYLDEQTQKIANLQEPSTSHVVIKDSNGVVLSAGDSVSLIKDLDVKGAGFTAKRGTSVKNISLTDNEEQIEGKINGIKIVLLSKFVKKI